MDKKVEVTIGGKPTVITDENRVENMLCAMMVNKINALAVTFEVDTHVVVMATLNAVSFASDKAMTRGLKQAGLSMKEINEHRIKLAKLLVEGMQFISENGVIKHATEGCGDPECKACTEAHPTPTKE